MHLLIVDDDTELSDMLVDYFQAEGFVVNCVYDGESGAEQALNGTFDAVVLDVMMPGIDGFETLRRIRAHSSVPVLMLTAKGDDIDRIVGLEIGADDYLPKPFNPRELLARLRAVLRRTQGGAGTADSGEGLWRVGGLEVNQSSRTAKIGDKQLELTSTEYSLLQALVKQSGQVVSKEQLSQQALGRGLEKYDRSIDMHMSNLRRKLAQQGMESLIITVRGVGYQLSVEQ